MCDTILLEGNGGQQQVVAVIANMLLIKLSLEDHELLVSLCGL
jgi:hypothetical protein